MKRRMTAFINLILFFFTSFLSPITVGATVNDNQSLVGPPPQYICRRGYCYEASTGLILYEKNIDNAYYPASIKYLLH